MPPKQLEARLHILYVEQAEDQRCANTKKRLAGLHLGVPKLGATKCLACDGVIDIWRGRLDNVQTSLRMCCAEGSIFRPSIAQFAVLSPRAALCYNVPRLGAWMTAQGTKRATESLVIGSALRVVAGELAPEECGIKHSAFQCSDDGANEGMWAWVRQWTAAVRSRARAIGGRSLVLTLNKSAPMLVPSPCAGTLASHLGEPSDISDIIVVIGGPAGVPSAWQPRLDAALGKPLLEVALRGSLQHSYAALLDLVLLHERNELVPTLLDRLVLTPVQLTQWMQAEQEFARAWLGSIGCVRRRSARSLYLGSPLLAPMRSPLSTAAGSSLDALLQRHRLLMDRLASEPQLAAPLIASGKTKKQKRRERAAAAAVDPRDSREKRNRDPAAWVVAPDLPPRRKQLKRKAASR